MTNVLIIGGDGGRSGVPLYIANVFDALYEVGDINVFVASGANKGGYDTAVKRGCHIEIPLPTFKYPVNLILAYFALRRVIANYEIDVIWANSTAVVAIARILAKHMSTKLIVTYHGVPFGQQGTFHSFIGRCTELLTFYNNSDLEIIISEVDKNILTHALRKEARRSKVVNNSINPSNFLSLPKITKGEKDSIHVLTVGRYSKQKNLELVLDIANCSGSKINFTIVGSGVSALREFVDARNLSNVTLIEELEDLSGLYQSNDVFLCTSRYEGFSLAMLEALMFDLPIVSTDVGGVVELHNAGAFVKLIEHNDPITIAHYIIDVCNTYAFGQNGKTFQREFNYENWKTNTLEAFYTIEESN